MSMRSMLLQADSVMSSPRTCAGADGAEQGVLLPVAMLAGRILGAAGGQLATRRQSLLDMMPAQRKDEVAKETVSRHPRYQSPSELLPMHEEPRSPFSLGFICAVPKGINETKPIG